MPHELAFLNSHSYWRAALRLDAVQTVVGAAKPLHLADAKVLHFGCLIARAWLSRCVQIDKVSELGRIVLETRRWPDRPGHETWCDLQLGDFRHGRWAWYLEDVRLLPKPVPYVGRQRLFNVPDRVYLDAMRGTA